MAPEDIIWDHIGWQKLVCYSKKIWYAARICGAAKVGGGRNERQGEPLLFTLSASYFFPFLIF
jgi:hypothetical protein